jgi:integrase
MYETGAQISDVVAIQPHHLDLENGRIWLERTKNDDPGEFFMTQDLAREIATLTPKRFPDGSRRVFGYKTRFGMAGAMKKTCERAGLAYLTPHEAGRHSFATELVTRRGIDAATVAKLNTRKNLAQLAAF